MKSDKIKQAVIHELIFDEDIIITYGDQKQLSRWYKNRNIDDIEIGKYTYGFTELLESEDRKFRHIHFSVYGFSIIVHETNHLAFEILDEKGIKLSKETKEIFAYYQDFLAGKCRDYMEKWTKKGKK